MLVQKKEFFFFYPTFSGLNVENIAVWSQTFGTHFSPRS